jgi:hypothetical protein
MRAACDIIAFCVRPLAGYGGSAALDAFLARTDILVGLLPLTSAPARHPRRPAVRSPAAGRGRRLSGVVGPHRGY